MDVRVRKYYGDIEVCATCGTGQLTRLRDGMIRKHKREVWENGQWTGSHEHCPGSGQPHIDLVAANNARSTQAEPQEPIVADTDFQAGQRIVVADGTTHTVVKMSRWANEPLRVEVEGGLQWLASECVPVPERTDATDRLDRLRAELDRTTAACEEHLGRSRTPAEQAAVTEYETAIAGIPDCFDSLDGKQIAELATYAASLPAGDHPGAEADKFVRGHLDMLSRWYDALDSLDSEIRGNVVEGGIPEWAQQYLKAEALELFESNTALLRAIAEYHHGSAGPLLDPEYGHAYQLSNSTLRPF